MGSHFPIMTILLLLSGKMFPELGFAESVCLDLGEVSKDVRGYEVTMLSRRSLIATEPNEFSSLNIHTTTFLIIIVPSQCSCPQRFSQIENPKRQNDLIRIELVRMSFLGWSFDCRYRSRNSWCKIEWKNGAMKWRTSPLQMRQQILNFPSAWCFAIPFELWTSSR